jgi:hypothetical protein
MLNKRNWISILSKKCLMDGHLKVGTFSSVSDQLTSTLIYSQTMLTPDSNFEQRLSRGRNGCFGAGRANETAIVKGSFGVGSGHSLTPPE